MPYNSEIERREAEGKGYVPMYEGEKNRTINQWLRDQIAHLNALDVEPDPAESQDDRQQRTAQAMNRRIRTAEARRRRNQNTRGTTFKEMIGE